MSRFSLRRRRPEMDEPRFELLPLLDVVIQLLFFFMIAFTMMTQVRTRTQHLAAVVGAEDGAGGASGGENRHFLVVDARGGFELDEQPIAREALHERLRKLGGEKGAILHVGLAAEGAGLDRGPAVFDLIQRITAAGIHEVTFTDLGAAP